MSGELLWTQAPLMAVSWTVILFIIAGGIVEMLRSPRVKHPGPGGRLSGGPRARCPWGGQ